MLSNVHAFRIKVFGRMSCVGGICKLGVVWPEDRPHHGMPGAVDLPPTARVRCEFCRAPEPDTGTGPQLRMLMRDF